MRDLATALTQRRAAHLYRSRPVVQAVQGVRIRVDGVSYVAFCSNDYLGLAQHPELVRALQQGAETYGVGAGAAHLISGHSAAHHALEEELADFVQRPRALLFSTGYMANLGVMAALLTRGDIVYQDRLNHASLLDGGLSCGARLQRYAHGDVADLAAKLQARRAAGERLIATDGVFSMDGDLAPLPDLARLAQTHDAWLMVDDAHGLGVVGPGGRGVLEYYRLGLARVPILMGTLGKALGTAGAFVAGSDELIETLIQAARTYIYTTAPPPAVAEASRAGLRLLRRESWRRDKLRGLVRRFRQGAGQLGLPLLPSETPIQPVLLGSAAAALDVAAGLRARGFWVTPVRPPTVPEGQARLRITLSAAHDASQVDALLEALAQISAATAPAHEHAPADHG